MAEQRTLYWPTTGFQRWQATSGKGVWCCTRSGQALLEVRRPGSCGATAQDGPSALFRCEALLEPDLGVSLPETGQSDIEASMVCERKLRLRSLTGSPPGWLNYPGVTSERENFFIFLKRRYIISLINRQNNSYMNQSIYLIHGSLVFNYDPYPLQLSRPVGLAVRNVLFMLPVSPLDADKSGLPDLSF